MKQIEKQVEEQIPYLEENTPSTCIALRKRKTEIFSTLSETNTVLFNLQTF